MNAPFQAHTLSISIDGEQRTIVDFISDPRNLPEWAKAFCSSVSKPGDDWLVETPQGTVKLRFVPSNPYGVVDHYVELPSGQVIYVPMRVLANGNASEVQFTLFRLSETTDRQFDEDMAMVMRDLHALKQVIEQRARPH